MNTNSPYVFTGLWPFIERIGRGRDVQHLGRARELWHCRQIQDSLGQLPRLDAESQGQLLAHVFKVRESLAIAIEGIDAAIQEVARELSIPLPSEDVGSGLVKSPERRRGTSKHIISTPGT